MAGTQKYKVVVPVTRASGAQCFEVEAASPEEAVRLVRDGEAECVEEELEVEAEAPREEWLVYDEHGRDCPHTERG
jgi:chromosome condensin MukBEF MukE localization factor